ncbi:MAG: hypothetical protein HY422_00800 [Candidatus Komeilibacteria bacterium]|nr:hypothetical protein [Candidatus Komeilibacteria bacterium]
MIADTYKPLIVLGVSGFLFFIIMFGWKYTQRNRGAELAQAIRNNFVSTIVAQGTAQTQAFQERIQAAHAATSSTTDPDLYN